MTCATIFMLGSAVIVGVVLLVRWVQREVAILKQLDDQ